MHKNFNASIGLLEGLNKLSKLENIESSLYLLELLSGSMIDVINEPTSQIDNALNNANKNEEIIDINTIILYGLQKLNILK